MTPRLDRRSLWLQEALPGVERLPSLAGEQTADVAVVGGGFTGLWTAIRLKQERPGLDVALLERDVCGAGASGRNGGFVLSWWAKFLSLEHVCGTEEALRLARTSAEAVDAIGAFCSEHGIDAGYRRDGWLWAATAPWQAGAWDETARRLAELGERPFRDLEPDEVAQRSGSAVHLAGVLEPTAATVQPARLALGLRRVAQELGVRVHEGTPMLRLERGERPRIVTPAGALRCGTAVLALNAWSVRLRELRPAIAVIASDVVATAAAPELLGGWRDGLCVDDSRMRVNYYRTTPEGRIVFGKGGVGLAYGTRVDADGPAPAAAEVTRCLHETYPAFAAVPVEHSWRGPIDRSAHGLPFFGPLPGSASVLVGAGFSGNGVGPSFLGGRILCSLALGLDDGWARCGLVRPPERAFPPEPLRFLGGRVVKAAVERKERALDAGRRPGRLSVRLAALAPAGLVPLRDS